ncbi:uncharacterized protein H6S33_002241 [Morchella sextelata]|uniref:uncharacterized protein n=1 Tax=Morchella sextelata TaxID=1174677 RepID=UPI001D05A803|nr:uncharacterized protein H6S33_002241 [Morchella sextelata]KAH0608189.1 hypothetical protein H6S33_002241 [Morchella sextelata]
MRIARTSQLLAGAALLSSTLIEAAAPPPSVCNNSPSELVPDGCASYDTIERLNKKLNPLLKEITHDTDYFSYYRLDLFGRTCPFWDDEGMCGNIACAVTTIDDEKDIPEIWRAEELGKLAGPKASHPVSREPTEPSPLKGALGTDREESCIVEEDECDERDYCVPEDETEGSRGDYVSLIENPERFTGYAGAGAQNVWKAIYRENCFDRHPELEEPKGSAGFSKRNPAAMEFAGVMQEKGKHEFGVGKDGKQSLVELDADDECLEKRVFHRVISGMHASISMHLCWDYLNQSTGEWGPNYECFMSRFKGHPERVQNIYFNYALLARAVSKLQNYLQDYTFCSGDTYQSRITRAKVLKLAKTAASAEPIFDESLMFRGEVAGLKEEFRNRFRNVSRLMDCVGCDKCRLWGKVQTQGYGTALKVLFEFDEDAEPGVNPVLRRTELVALVNTLHRVSDSLVALDAFKAMWDQRQAEELEAKREAGRRAAAGPRKEGEVEPTIKELFVEEVKVVWMTLMFVMRSWYEVPKHLMIIGLSEASQLWDRAMGRAPREAFYSWKGDNYLNPKNEL